MKLATSIRTRGRWLRFMLVLTVFGLSQKPARAERDLHQPQSASWQGHQFAVISGLTLANTAALTLFHPVAHARSNLYFWNEGGTVDNESPLTARVSDIGLMSSIAIPVATTATQGRRAFTNSMLIYTEAVELSFFVNTLVKRLVRRARPFTLGSRSVAMMQHYGADSFYSFYSGHSSVSFTSATSGSILFNAIEPDEALSATHFGGTLAIAALTAHARVRAGRHYPSDVLVGAAIGVGWGLLVPAVHQVSLKVSPIEAASAASGTLLGFALAYLLPNRVTEEVANFNPSFHTVPGGGVVSLGWSGDLHSSFIPLQP